MAVKIRLRRMGAKKKPFYRVVVADSRSPRDGRFIEELGTYDPMKEPAEIKVDGAKVARWIKNGAQPTETVKALLKRIDFEPGDFVQAEAGSAKAEPAEAVQDEAAQGEAVQGEAVQAEAAPDEAVQDETVDDDADGEDKEQ